MRAGSRGFCGVSTNLHPDLYAWLYRSPDTDLARDLESFLVTAALSEAFGYPALAKICHQRLGTLTSIRCRVIDYDVRERFWGLDAIVDALMAGADGYRARIAAAAHRRRRPWLTSCSP
jgi:4-hydroxy-tetrahydrodipicolinate synthase